MPSDSYTSIPESLDNLPPDYAEQELGFATTVLRAELMGVAFRNPGGGRLGEFVMRLPNNGGQFGVASVTKLQAAKMARDLIDYAMDGL